MNSILNQHRDSISIWWPWQ